MTNGRSWAIQDESQHCQMEAAQLPPGFADTMCAKEPLVEQTITKPIGELMGRVVLFASLGILVAASWACLAGDPTQDDDEKANTRVAEQKGWLDDYKKGRDILLKLTCLSSEEQASLDITAYRESQIAIVAASAPPGATNDLVTKSGFYLRVVNPEGKDLRAPHCAWEEVLVRGTVLQVLPRNKIIVIRVLEKDWVVMQTG